MLFLALICAAVACGGGGGGSSGPLSRRFDDGFIGGVEMNQKTEMMTASNSWSEAKFERSKVDADLTAAELQLKVAKNEAKGAKLKEDSARAARKSADASADQNKINEAMRQLRAAEKFRKAGELRVKYLEAYKNYLKAELRAADDNAYWYEAQFEVQKAKIAKANNIAPKGFSYDDYTRQESDRRSRAANAKAKAAREKQRAYDARNKWLQMQSEADTMIGVKNQLTDPMAPKPIQGSDMTRGAGGITIGNGTESGSASPQ
jgi:hypothetical protein